MHVFCRRTPSKCSVTIRSAARSVSGGLQVDTLRKLYCTPDNESRILLMPSTRAPKLVGLRPTSTSCVPGMLSALCGWSRTERRRDTVGSFALATSALEFNTSMRHAIDSSLGRLTRDSMDASLQAGRLAKMVCNRRTTSGVVVRRGRGRWRGSRGEASAIACSVAACNVTHGADEAC
jgi:hypothetical protein